MTEVADDTLLTAAEVASMLKVSPRTVSETWLRKGVTNGFPKPVRLGSGTTKRWKKSEIMGWLETRR